MATLSQNWNLDVFFPGGSQSAEFHRFLEALDGDIAAVRRQVAAPPAADRAGLDALIGLIESVQQLFDRLEEGLSFCSCLTAQNVQDEQANLLTARLQQIHAGLDSVQGLLDQRLLEVPAALWPDLLADPRMAPVAFHLEERRRRATERLPAAQEELITDLAVDGYHAWDFLHRAISGRIAIPFDEDGQVKLLSVGQAENRLRTGNRAVREQLFQRTLDAWAQQAELCASTLNHLGGFRLAMYRHRGWDSVLKEPLDNNRMSAATLEAMWGTVDRNKDIVVAYFRRKAALLGLPALAWHDVHAPLGGQETRLSYDQAVEFIVEQFARFSPHMADFARRAAAERWVEAEDRPGKRAGAFDTAFPLGRQSRVFMTFSGVLDNAMTLAHELGHGYHDAVTFGLPHWARDYAMNVAETASTFAETIVANAAIAHAASPQERLTLLNQRAADASDFLMNLHARFVFEVEFYDERRRGPLSVQRLNDLMVDAQRHTFRDALSEWHPYFWAAKLHFYRTRQPFYNFPYTFGYLFSTGLYARAREEGPAFAHRYIDLLQDTGRMTVEDLAARHLGVDLTRPDFWQAALDVISGEIRDFLAATEAMAADR